MKDQEMYCPNCGLDVVLGVEECPHCGAKYDVSQQNPDQLWENMTKGFITVRKAVTHEEKKYRTKEEKIRDKKEERQYLKRLKREKNKTRNFVLCLVAITLLIIFLIVGRDTLIKLNDMQTNDKGVAYETGRFDGLVYHNEWAELTINAGTTLCPGAYTDQKYTELFFDDKTEICLQLLSRGNNAVVVTSHFGTGAGISEKKYSKEKYLKQGISSRAEHVNIVPQDDITLCGQLFRCYMVQGDIDGDLVKMYVCYRKIGNRILAIRLYGYNNINDPLKYVGCFQ